MGGHAPATRHHEVVRLDCSHQHGGCRATGVSAQTGRERGAGHEEAHVLAEGIHDEGEEQYQGDGRHGPENAAHLLVLRLEHPGGAAQSAELQPERNPNRHDRHNHEEGPGQHADLPDEK